MSMMSRYNKIRAVILSGKIRPRPDRDMNSNILENISLKINLHAPTSGHTTTNKSLLGALGIPELMPLNWRQTFKVNLHAPTSGCTTINKSLLGRIWNT